MTESVNNPTALADELEQCTPSKGGYVLVAADTRDEIVSALRLPPQHPDVREALESDVLSILYTYRDHEPEEDESWESWYFAAFDLACMAVRARFRAPPVLGQGTEKKK